MAIAIGTLVLGTLVPHRPGLYLDAVNPDYLAIKILHPAMLNTIWVLPGNLIHNRFPILAGALYHGSLQAYLAVPFAWLLGPGMPTLRLQYACEALAVCFATFALVRLAAGSVRLAALAAMPLAVDPAFIFAFRTQANIVTVPVCFSLCGCILLLGHKPRPLAAGILLGLAAWGYFVHLFVLPGVFLFLLTRRPAVRPALALTAGLLVGGLPYLTGYARIVQFMGSLHDTTVWARLVIGDLHVGTAETLAARVGATLNAAAIALTGDWIWRVVWGVWHTDEGQVAKLALLLATPLAALPFARRSALLPAYRLLAMILISFIGVAAGFGSRLGAHHFQLLLPPLYALFALSLGIIAQRSALAGRALVPLGAALVLVNFTGSAWDLHHFRSTEGATFYADAIADFPRQALAGADRSPLIYMDWGGLMPFTYLTDGQIPAYGQDEITGYGRIPLLDPLCRLGRARLVFLGTGAADRGRATLAQLHLAATPVQVLHDRSGSFDYAVFSTAVPADRCKAV